MENKVPKQPTELSNFLESSRTYPSVDNADMPPAWTRLPVKFDVRVVL